MDQRAGYLSPDHSRGRGTRLTEAFFQALEDARKELDALTPRIPPAEVSRMVEEGEAVPATLEMKPPEAPKPIASPPPPPIGSPTPGDGADSPEKTSRSSMQKTLGFVALGIGGAGILLGGVTGGLAVGKHGELSDACPNGECSPNLQGDLDSYHTLGTLSTVGFVVGGLGAAAGAVGGLIATLGLFSACTSLLGDFEIGGGGGGGSGAGGNGTGGALSTTSSTANGTGGMGGAGGMMGTGGMGGTGGMMGTGGMGGTSGAGGMW